MEIKEIQIEKIDLRKDNPRTTTGAKDLKELAQSLDTTGLINPITVREKAGDRVELIAGFRRLSAARINGWKKITANVLGQGHPEQDVQEISAVENLQRKDLSVFEQAEEIKKLLSAGWTVESVAADLGKSESWLRKRASVTDLSDVWKKAIKNNRLSVSKWPAQHLELIGRMPKEAQDRLAKAFEWEMKRGRPDLGDIQRALQSEQMILAGAPFKIGDETLVPKVGSCLTCKKVSGRQPALFDDVVDRKGKATDACLDNECYRVKANAHLKRKVAELKKSGTDFILIGSRRDMKGLTSSWALEKARKGDKKIVIGLYVDFPECGRTAKFRKPKSGTNAAIGGERKPKNLKERKDTITRRREALVCAWILGELNKVKEERIARKKNVTYLIKVLAMIGTNHRADTHGESDWIKIGTLKPRSAVVMLWESVVLVLQLRLGYYRDPPSKEMDRITGFLGLDIKKMREKARKEIPDPKTWAFLNADGSRKTKKKKGKGRKTKSRK